MRLAREMLRVDLAAQADFLEIARLDRSAWGAHGHGLRVPDGDHAWRIWVEYAIVVCSRWGNRIIGVAVAFPCTQGDLYCIHKIFVERERRGQGVGTRLMRRLLDELDVLGVDIILTVDPAHVAAVGFYRSFGFSIQGHFPDYYGTGEHRLLLLRKRPSAKGV